MKPHLLTYQFYKIAMMGSGVAVFDPRFPRDDALFKTDSVDKAKAWIRDYRAGFQWAVDAALTCADLTLADKS